MLDRFGSVAGGLILGCWLIFIARQAASFRPAAGNRRQQLKWLLFGAVCCAVATAITVLAGNGASATAQAVQDAADLGAAALPVGIGIGIVKYRLYDIEKIISRTLSYAVVTGVLVGVYAGLVLLAGLVVPSSSPAAVAGATLVVAALFRPLHRRVQRAVNRRFNRDRYDAGKVIDGFAARLQESVDLTAIRDDLASTVYAALEPAHLSIWLRLLISQTAGAWRPGSSAPAVWQGRTGREGGPAADPGDAGIGGAGDHAMMRRDAMPHQARPCRATPTRSPLAAELAQSFAFSPEQFRLSYPALLAADGACLLLAVDGQERLGYLLGFQHLTFYANGPVAWAEEVVRPRPGPWPRRRPGPDGRVRAVGRRQGCALVALATRRAAPFYRALGLRGIRRLLPQGARSGRVRLTDAVPSTNANVSVKAISSSG